MARPSFSFGKKETKAPSKFSFLKEDEEKDNPLRSVMRSGLSRAFEPVEDIPNLADRYKAQEETEPNFPAMQAFSEFMQKGAPMQEDYAPGLGRKIGAALVGLGAGFKNPALGYQATRDILNTPFRNAYTDWANQADSLKANAEIEKDTIENTIKLRKDERDEARADATIAQGDRKLDQDEDRLLRDLNNDKIKQEQDRLEYEARGWRTEKVDGRIIMINPITDKKVDLGPDADIEIRKKQLDINQQNANTNKFSADTGRMNAETNERNVDSLEETRMWNSLNNFNRTNNATAAGRRPKNVPIREYVQAEYQAAAELARENPAYAKYIGDDGSVKRPTNWFGRDAVDTEEFERFMDALELRQNAIIEKQYGKGSRGVSEPEEELVIDWNKG